MCTQQNNMPTPLLYSHVVHDEDYFVLDTRWIPQTVKFVSVGAKTNNTGMIKIHGLNENKIDTVQEFGHEAPIKCCTFGVSAKSNSFLTTGNFHGGLQIIDVTRPGLFVYNVSNAHNSVINGVDVIASSGSSEIVTGGKDGLIKVWDPRQHNRPTIEIRPAKHMSGDCWSVSFANSYNYNGRAIVGGFGNGDLKIFDLRTLKPIIECNDGYGICNVECKDKYGIMLSVVCGTTQGKLQVHDIDENFNRTCISTTIGEQMSRSTPENKEKPSSSQSTTMWSVRHLPQNSHFFATGDGTGHVRLWSHCATNYRNEMQQLFKLKIGSAAVNSFDWHPSRTGLAVCSSFDKQINIVGMIA